jgi:hypothetical protein
MRACATPGINRWRWMHAWSVIMRKTDGNRASPACIEQNRLAMSEEHQHQKQDQEASRNSSLPNGQLPERGGGNANNVMLSSDQILSLTGIMTADNNNSFRSQHSSPPQKSERKRPKPKPVTEEDGAPEMETQKVPPSTTHGNAAMTSNQIGSTPGAYKVEDTAMISVPAEGAGSPVVVASAIDKEALEDEIRQELMANATSAQVLIVEVPQRQDDTESGRKGSSSRISMVNNRNWWIILAIVFIVVAGVVAVVVVLADESGGGDGGGGKKGGDGDGGGGKKGGD